MQMLMCIWVFTCLIVLKAKSDRYSSLNQNFEIKILNFEFSITFTIFN